MASERLAGVRATAERVARSYGLEIFDVQLRRESIGTVLRVVIDRPDNGGIETPEDAVGIEDCQKVSHDLSAILDVEEEQVRFQIAGEAQRLDAVGGLTDDLDVARLLQQKAQLLPRELLIVDDYGAKQ